MAIIKKSIIKYHKDSVLDLCVRIHASFHAPKQIPKNVVEGCYNKTVFHLVRHCHPLCLNKSFCTLMAQISLVAFPSPGDKLFEES